MTDRLAILVLHAMGDMSRARRTSVNHARFLADHQPGHDYVFHDCHAPVPPELRSIRFDAVLLDTTFLCMRYLRPRSAFEAIRDRYAWVADLDAVVVAFPQDEYDHGEILDEWLEAYRTDVVYSVVWNGWDLFFPRVSRRAEVLRALTGYVADADVAEAGRYARPFHTRGIDVGYRARELPPQFGSHGQLKTRLGTAFAERVRDRGLRLDISTRPEDVLLGDHWLRFLGNSRHTLGCEGGSSVWDPRGEIRDRVAEYLEREPAATYEEVERACFPGLDRQRVFSAISPRLFEVAAARSSQILVPAAYLGVLSPDEHYLPLAADASNADEVVSALGDPRGAERRIEATWEALIRPDTFRYSWHATQVMRKILEIRARRGGTAANGAYRAAAARHAEFLGAHFRRERRRVRLATTAQRLRLAVPQPLRRLLRRLIRGR